MKGQAAQPPSTIGASELAQRKHPYPGRFIAAEGIDGAGKSWTVEELHKIVEEIDGSPPVMVREPGGTPFGEGVRNVLAQFRRDISPVAQALAFNASRRELTDRVIRPALMEGKTVITDRWTPSTRVYQHQCPGPILEVIIAAAAAELIDADVTILFTRSPADAVEAKITEYGEERRQQEIKCLEELQNRYLAEMKNAEPRPLDPLPIREHGAVPGTNVGDIPIHQNINLINPTSRIIQVGENRYRPRRYS